MALYYVISSSKGYLNNTYAGWTGSLSSAAKFASRGQALNMAVRASQFLKIATSVVKQS
jgi:hypothetical protein